MLKAEQVPDEVVKAALLTDERLGMREVITAAINAWPGMQIVEERADMWAVYLEIAPLPQEASDE